MNFPDNLMPTIAYPLAAFVVLLSILQGPDITSFFVEELVKKFDLLYKELQTEDINENSNIIPKNIHNLLLLLVYMFNYKAVNCKLIYDLLKLLLQKCKDLDIQLISIILEYCGFHLRKDDPSVLKEILIMIQNHDLTKQSESSKRKAFIDLIVDLKNNKQKPQYLLEIEKTQKIRKILNSVVSIIGLIRGEYNQPYK